jgi:hypothetical protein
VARTASLPCSTRDTVDFDTPAAAAISTIVTLLRTLVVDTKATPQSSLLERSNFGVGTAGWPPLAAEIIDYLSKMVARNNEIGNIQVSRGLERSDPVASVRNAHGSITHLDECQALG